MNVVRRRDALSLLLAGLTLPGCAGLVVAEPPKLFALTPKTTFGNLPDSDAVIIVEPATATAGLNTARIALRPEPTLLEYYANSRWVDVVPVMVQTLIVETLDSTNIVQGLLPTEASGTRPDYLLRVNIREFQAEYLEGVEAPPTVNIRIQSRLLELPRREQVDALDELDKVVASGTTVSEIVLAFDQALGRVLKRLGTWVVETTA